MAELGVTPEEQTHRMLFADILITVHAI